MSVLMQYKCPCCDGAIQFDIDVQKMKCPYCDSEFEADALMAYEREMSQQNQDEFTWDTTAGGAWQEGESDDLRIYTCNTCAGEIVADETTGATACPFCGNPVVMIGQFSHDLKPDLVIPFKVDKDTAMAALWNHYKGKLLLPRVFRQKNKVEEVKGIYVPFWLFDTDVDAHIRYKATRVRSWRSGNYRYTETKHYLLTRTGNIGFENVPVDGSSKITDELMESIEPFDISQAVDFNTAYLSGYLADRYDVDAVTSIERANERIRKSTEQSFADTAFGYDTVVPTDSNIRLSNGRIKYALYPVWILNTVWKDQKFIFAVNGQTGKLAGNLPMSKLAFWLWFFGIFAVALVLVHVLFLM